MTWKDPIVDEVRKARDTYAKRFNYDFEAIFRDLKDKERKSGKAIVPCVGQPKATPISDGTPKEEPA